MVEFNDRIQQVRRGQSMAEHAGAPQGKVPDYLEEFRKKMGVGTPVELGMPSLQGGGSGGGGSKFDAFVKAIAGQESGGNGYGKVNPDSGATGKYQIMPSNIPNWSNKILGRTLTQKQFLNSPALQDRIARGMLQNYVKKYGYSGAAAAWYGGPGVADNWSSRTNPEGKYPSIASYVNQIMRRMG